MKSIQSLAILLASILGLIHIPAVHAAPSLAATHIKRQVEVLGSDFTRATCELGFWSDADRKGEGRRKYPLGAFADFESDETREKDNACVNVKDWGFPIYVERVLGFALTGRCECDFFQNENCDKPLFSAFNREDSRLDNHKKTDGPAGIRSDQMKSYKCRFKIMTTDTENPFIGGTMQLESFGLDAYISDAPVLSNGDFQDGQTECKPIPESFQTANIHTKGITCRFYEDDSCHNRLEEIGNAGVTTVYWTGVPKLLGSYRCYAPWGIAWEPITREKLQEAIDRIRSPQA
ncbi:hypothetical protein H072_2919 [Dactylellina haptotyla CBS 200.50]|uniref:Uncharacterized protein n=1 Tax=Dactylellina haptotyla (strain CBS 200.50) TaxID=1284197 RepID=S8AJK6_DACHA|nr:hypothetical protein H072_2919 [Dactylellina haptotyla CBS 200.50]